jgi:hypothetical protein
VTRHVSFCELPRTVLPPLLLAGTFTLVAFLATGATTGLFFAGVVIATLLTPPLVLSESTLPKQLLCAAAVVIGIATIEMFAVADPSVTFMNWLRAALILTSYALALCGLALFFSRLGFRVSVAAAIVIALSLAWLAWPIWLSPWMAGRERLVGILSTPHPLLALDSVFRATGPPWSERYYMYNLLTVLNQDVAYELPRSIFPALLFHGAIGATALLLGRRRRVVRVEVDVPEAPEESHGQAPG